MTNWLIVGGGISGMLAARAIRSVTQNFRGVEKADKLGGRAWIGPHRVYSKTSADFLTGLFSELTWDFIDDKPQERLKGSWEEIRIDLSATELCYLRAPFFRASNSMGAALSDLSDEVSEAFRFHVQIEQIDLEKKTASLSNGEEVHFDKIAWCSPLEAMTKLLRDRMPKLPKAVKTNSGSGGLSYEAKLAKDIFPTKNGVVLPFRYKEHRLRALGFASPGDGEETTVSWILTLDKELTDDREEVAKCVRALKREIAKEFPETTELLRGERIVFIPRLTGESAPAVESLELLPDLYYVGAEIRLVDTEENLVNLDLALANARAFEIALGGSGDALPVRHSEEAQQSDC